MLRSFTQHDRLVQGDGMQIYFGAGVANNAFSRAS